MPSEKNLILAIVKKTHFQVHNSRDIIITYSGARMLINIHFGHVYLYIINITESMDVSFLEKNCFSIFFQNAEIPGILTCKFANRGKLGASNI